MHPTIKASSTRFSWLALGMLSLASALASIALQGFQFGVSNNVFHVPYVLRLYDAPEFAADAFYQSLKHFASWVWPMMSLVATPHNVATVFFLAHVLSRWMAFVAILLVVRDFGLRTTVAVAVLNVLFVGSRLFEGSSPVGKSGLFMGYFTHSEVTHPFLLVSMFLLARRRLTLAFLVNGFTFNINAFIGSWGLAALSVTTLCITRVHGVELTLTQRLKRLLLPVVVNLAVASPTIWWIAQSSLAEYETPPFDYIGYLRLYAPQHFLIEAATGTSLLVLGSIVLSGLIALQQLQNATHAIEVWRKLYVAFLVIFLVGMILPSLSGSRFLLNLHLLRVDGVVVLLATLFVLIVTVQHLPLSSPWSFSALRPEVVILLAAVMLGQWYVVVMAMVVLQFLQAKQNPWLVIVLLLLLALFSASAEPALIELWGPVRVIPMAAGALCLYTAVIRSSAAAAAFAIVMCAVAVTGDAQRFALSAGTVLVATTCWPLERSRWPVLLLFAAALCLGIAALRNAGSAANVAILSLAGAVAAVFALGHWHVLLGAWLRGRYVGGMLTVGLLIVPIVATGYSRMSPPGTWYTRLQAYRAVQAWARQMTPAHAVFLVPLHPLGFQLGAQRRIWVDWKQGAAVMWDPGFYAQWYARYTEVGQLQALADWQRYACERAIDYLVFDRGPEGPLSQGTLTPAPIFENGSYSVFSRRQFCTEDRAFGQR
jgi:hypothetical protein